MLRVALISVASWVAILFACAEAIRLTAIGITATVILGTSVLLFVAASAVAYRTARKAAPTGMAPWALTVVLGMMSSVAMLQLGINAVRVAP